MKPLQVTVLLIESHYKIVSQVREMLDNHELFQGTLHHVSSCKEAHEFFLNNEIDVILFDLLLPDTTGIDSLLEVQARSHRAPIILLTCYTDFLLAEHAARHGIHDCLAKNELHAEVLFRSLRYAHERHLIEVDLNTHKERSLISRSIGSKELCFDPLTKLPKVELFNEQLHQAISRARRCERSVGVICIGIDLFERVNENLGHFAGDKILKDLAKRISNALFDADCLTRIAGDEFMILASDLAQPKDLELIQAKLATVFEKPFYNVGKCIYLTCSMGASLYPCLATSSSELVKQSSIAMHYAKHRGRNGFRLFTSSMSHRTFHRFTLQNDLREAIQREELELHYQPILDTEKQQVIKAEALIRWNHPKLGRVMPNHFIPLAEETGLIVPIGKWVLESACLQNKAWLDEGLGPIAVSVNLSTVQFQGVKFREHILGALKKSMLDVRYLELELTEGTIMQDLEESIMTLRALRKAGLSIAIDDFGTGHSSLSQLKRIPATTLKMDRSFIMDVLESEKDAAIVSAVISMAAKMNLSVVAEGVETKAQLDFLKSHDCHQIQGYLLGKPMPVVAFTHYLRGYGQGQGYQSISVA